MLISVLIINKKLSTEKNRNFYPLKIDITIEAATKILLITAFSYTGLILSLYKSQNRSSDMQLNALMACHLET